MTATPIELQPDRADRHRQPARVMRLGRRRATDRAAWLLCGVALALVVIPVVSVVVGVVGRAVGHWHWGVLVHEQVGNGGGLLNMWVGTLLITAGVVVLSGAVGVAGGVWLAEYCAEGHGAFVRGGSQVLAGVPSIVLGYVGYAAFVTALGWDYSLLAAWIVVGLFVVPYVMSTTEAAVRNVPTAYREGAEALGMRSGYALRKVVVRPALPGMVTGLIFAAAISVGETAPLLYTAGYNSNLPGLKLTHSPVGYLTYGAFKLFDSPFASGRDLAFDCALLLVAMVLVLIVVARVLVSLTQKYAPDRSLQRK